MEPSSICARKIVFECFYNIFFVEKVLEKRNCAYIWEHRFLECSGTQGSNSSGARGGGGREHITPELRVEPWVRTCRTQVQLGV